MGRRKSSAYSGVSVGPVSGTGPAAGRCSTLEQTCKHPSAGSGSVDHPSGEVRPGRERVKLNREHSCCPKWELVSWPAVRNQVIPASWERRGPVQRVRAAGLLRQKLPLGRAEERQQELGNLFFYQTLTVCGLFLTFFCLNPVCSH